ncbi:MAG: 2'-5' RNA ligase family protein, partial [Candidatus Heimdallarchaeaceae archaeon]
KYGFTTTDPEDIKPYLKDIAGLTANIADIDIFENKDFDVVILKITSENMTELHNKLDELPNNDKFPEYHPHMTIAYVKKGLGKKYKDMDIGDLEGASLVFDEVEFSGSDGNKTTIPLKDDGTLEESMATAKQRYLDTGKVNQNQFDLFASMDTTPTKKYIEWLAKQWVVNDERFESREKAQEYLDLFTKLTDKNIIKQKDINSYKSLKDLVATIDTNKETVTKTQQKKVIEGDIEKVFENDEVVIIKPKSKAAANKYGKGTKWCISATDSENYFNKYYYDDKVTFYFVFSKVTMNNEFDKIALAVYPSGDWEVYDSLDNQMDTDDFLIDMIDVTGLEASQLLEIFQDYRSDTENRDVKREEFEATEEELENVIRDKMYNLAYEINDFGDFKESHYSSPVNKILNWIEENRPEDISRDKQNIDIEDDAIIEAMTDLNLYYTHDEIYQNTIDEITYDIRGGNFNMDEDNYELVDEDDMDISDVHNQMAENDDFPDTVDGVEKYSEEALGQALLDLDYIKLKHPLDLDQETLINWILKNTGGRYSPGDLEQLDIKQLQSMIDDIEAQQASMQDPKQQQLSFESLDKKFDTMLLETIQKNMKKFI